MFTIHVLSAEPDLMEESLEIIRTLGGRTGRDGDKLGQLATKPGVTGAPILTGALSYVECRVTGSLDNEENTIFVGDVVAAEKLHSGRRLDVGTAWAGLGKEWTTWYDEHHEAQVEQSRRLRGLI